MTKVFDVIAEVRKLDGRLPKQEQKIATCIFDNLVTAPHLKQDEIAKSAGTSVATVNRFCRSLECSGLRDFNLQLAQNVAVGLQYVLPEQEASRSEDELVSQVFEELKRGLTKAQSQLASTDIQAAVDILAAARRIASSV